MAAQTFDCARPSHHDGDNIHCDGTGSRSMRLYGIDAPEMPGACRPGRECTPGDPYAARATLQGLTRGHAVVCRQVDTDVYGRRIVRCTADGIDLSCAMVASGTAVERYGRLDCGGGATRRPDQHRPRIASEAAVPLPFAVAPPAVATPERRQGDTPPLSWIIVGAALLALNLATYAAFAIDKRRARGPAAARRRRIPESVLLGLAAAGGSLGAVIARQRLRHKTQKQPFAARLTIIAGVHLGILFGLMLTRG